MILVSSGISFSNIPIAKNKNNATGDSMMNFTTGYKSQSLRIEPKVTTTKA